jgi:5,6-dimethylbenzimidazole synthase
VLNPILQPDHESFEHLLRVFAWRRDVRHFEPRPVDAATVLRLIEIAQCAPSVGFSQPWRFVRVDSPERRQAIRDNFLEANRAAALQYPEPEQLAYGRLKLSGLDTAPVHLAVFLDSATTRGRGLGRQTMPETLAYSAVMAIHTLWLAATALNLGVGWVSILDPAAAKRSLDVPEHWSFLAYLCLGYPSTQNTTPELERLGWERRDERSIEQYRR